jgi:hypothetical protein
MKPDEAIAEQRAAYTALLQSLGQASVDEIKVALDQREAAQPEKDLSPEVIEKLEQRIEREA